MKHLSSWVMHYSPYKQYPCENDQGELVVGFGRNLTQIGIAYDEALGFLAHDLAVVKKQLKKFAWYSSQPTYIQQALEHLAYAMDLHNLLQERELLSNLKDKDYTKAALSVIESQWGRINPTQAKDIACEIRSRRY